MKLRTLVISLALAGLLVSPAVAAGPGSAIMATVNGVIAAGNADSASKVNSYFISSAAIVDEFAPYSWSGPNAGAAWWNALDRMNVRTHSTNLHVSVQKVTQFDITGNKAYVVVPLLITYKVKGKPARETGLWALTLRRSGSVYKIATASWATATSTM